MALQKIAGRIQLMLDGSQFELVLEPYNASGKAVDLTTLGEFIGQRCQKALDVLMTSDNAVLYAKIKELELKLQKKEEAVKAAEAREDQAKAKKPEVPAGFRSATKRKKSEG